MIDYLMMSKFLFKGLLISLLLSVALLLAACGARPPAVITPSEVPAVSATVMSTVQPTQTRQLETITTLQAYPDPGELPYPPPELVASPMPTDLAGDVDDYPPPSVLPTHPPPTVLPGYPPPSTWLPTEQSAYPAPAIPDPSPDSQLTQPSSQGGDSPSPTADLAITERVVFPAMPPPSSNAIAITIWHSWSESEAVILEDVLQAFQMVNPNIYFDVLYIPFDDLLRTFQAAAYRGTGPSILLAPAEWGPQLYDDDLVAPVDDLAAPAFLERINPAALDSARYRGALISLPHAIRNGVVMYRNMQIVPQAPDTFSDLIVAAKAATRGGRVGAYLERGYFYSIGHLAGMGGNLMDESGNPTFNNQTGLAWLDLLIKFEQAGPVSFNTNRDLDLFKDGRVGIIFDGTWARESLVEAIGEENLSIDPWPAYQDGHLSGYVQTDNMYLTARSGGDERYAALQFFGFMLAPEVQSVLTRAGHIPALIDVKVEEDWMESVMAALLDGTAYPTHPNVNLYWDPLETAMGYVFNQSALPAPALKQANDVISALIQDTQE
jgi:maltose-binding protein MalE